jgi:hypothetical protein
MVKKYEVGNYIGKKFGKWTILEEVDMPEKRGKQVKCQCECGRINILPFTRLFHGYTSSCTRCASITHGYRYTRLYGVWRSMKTRCYCKSHPNYKNYGGRGIIVCNEWRNDFPAFRKWAYSNGYDENAIYGKCTLDRIDVNGNYCPENCRFVDMQVQVTNQRISPKNTTGYTGIRFDHSGLRKKKWSATVTVNMKCIFLGEFETQKEALAVRNKYIKDHDLPHKIQEYTGEIIKTQDDLYKLWNLLKVRKYRKNAKSNLNICEEWLDYTNFHDWAINNGYKKGLTIAKIDYMGIYEPNNCRFTSNAQNVCRSTNKSGYLGICWHKLLKKWRCRITINRKRINLGCFKTQKEALDMLNKYIIDNGLDYPIQEYKGEIGSLE